MRLFNITFLPKPGQKLPKSITLPSGREDGKKIPENINPIFKGSHFRKFFLIILAGCGKNPSSSWRGVPLRRDDEAI
jgi:hypothetical protein